MLWQLSDHALAEAAAVLSSLTPADANLDLVSTGSTGIRQLVNFFNINEPQTIAISQPLQGMISGHIVLLLQDDCCVTLLREILSEKANLREMTQMEEEALIEIGNIILNSFVASFAEVVKGRTQSRLPVLARGHFAQLLEGFAGEIGADQVCYALLNFSSRSTRCQGCILWTRLPWNEQD